jgi:hypothetical protein
MAIFVTDKKEKKVLEALGFEVHLESVIGESADDRSAVPLPYVISQILNKRKKDIERLKRENCDRCRALKALSDNIYHQGCAECFNRQCGEPGKYQYQPDEEFKLDTAVEMRENVAVSRFQGNFYRVYIPDVVKDLLNSYGEAFTRDLRHSLEEALGFETTQIITDGLKEITIIGRIERITSKAEMKKIDDFIHQFCHLHTLKYNNKFRIDYKGQKTVLGIYMSEKTLDDIKRETQINE